RSKRDWSSDVCSSDLKTIRLVRIHLEEDAGKLLHETPYDDVPGNVSLVDWNRCGVPLVEIVSEPDIRSSEEAASYLTELRRLLRSEERRVGKGCTSG